MGAASISAPSSCCPSRRSLLGPAPHCLDSWRPWSCCGYPVESQKPEEAFLLASHLEAREELGKRSGIERFFGRVFLFFHLQRPPLCGWSEMASQVALTYAASVIVGLAVKQAGRPDLIRSPKRVLAHLWEGDSEL